MEVQTCAFESPAITKSDYYYGKINIGSVIICFLIIYSTALSIVLSVKQLIQVIKEEELIMEMEEEDEEEEEESNEEVVKVDVQTQATKEEEEVIEKQEDKEKNEDELQSKHIKQIQFLFEKKIKNASLGGYECASGTFWNMLKKENPGTHPWLHGYANKDLLSLTCSVKPITDILASLCKKNRETINKELDEEILFNVKKAGLFVFHSDYDEIEFYKDTYELFKIVKMVDFSNMSLEEQARQNKFSHCIDEYRNKMKWNASQCDEDEDEDEDKEEEQQEDD